MFDLDELKTYRENNRPEAKKALGRDGQGELPRSVWETFSAFANPGDFRMPVEEARKPGSTDPRNAAMMRMFSMVEIGERAGSGMDKIFEGWRWAGYGAPSYDVAYGPDRTTLTLPLTYAGAESAGKVSAEKSRQILKRLACTRRRARARWRYWRISMDASQRNRQISRPR